jgi:NADH:ubiquinone oxidoreductase subunit 5 (subunit L)/multisubunit Na+/H+ antiporter MnhA subunit
MNLTDLILAATPLGLVGVGAALFFFGWVLGGPESRVFYSVVVATALAAFLSQVSLGVGFARNGGVRTPAATLYTWSPVGDAGFRVKLAFQGDLLSFLFALPLTALALLCVFYLLVRQPTAEKGDAIATGRLYGLIFLAEGAGLGAFYSADLVVTYFWLEAAGLALYLLSGPGLRGASAQPISYRALGINFLAGQLIFAPLLVMVSRNGGNSTYADFIPAVIDATLFALVVAGCLVKAAQFPFQSWIGGFEDLPGAAYGLLLTGFVFPFAVYLPARLQALEGGQADLIGDVSWLLLPAGALTVFFAAFTALRSRSESLTVRIGLLTAVQFGFVIMALGQTNLAAAFQQLIALVPGAALLFLCADQLQIENAQPPNPEGITNPKPLGRPALFRGILVITYLVGALNFAGFPLTPAYTARWQTLGTLLDNGYRFYFGLAVAGLVLMLPALVQDFVQFLNGPRRTVDSPTEGNYWPLAVPVLLALGSLVLGFQPGLANGWISNATGRVQLTGDIRFSTVTGVGWLGLFVVIGLTVGFGVVWLFRRNLVVAPFNGGLVYGQEQTGGYTYARTGRSKMALKTVEPEEELPEGFEDEFFSGAFKKTQEKPHQAARRKLPDARLSPADYFGPLTVRLASTYRIFDLAFNGNFFGRLLMGFLARARRVFEWTVERFYPALAAFILLIFIILLTR